MDSGLRSEKSLSVAGPIYKNDAKKRGRKESECGLKSPLVGGVFEDRSGNYLPRTISDPDSWRCDFLSSREVVSAPYWI